MPGGAGDLTPMVVVGHGVVTSVKDGVLSDAGFASLDFVRRVYRGRGDGAVSAACDHQQWSSFVAGVDGCAAVEEGLASITCTNGSVGAGML